MDGNSSKETKGAMPADCKEGRIWIWPGVLITVTIVAIWFWGGYHKFITHGASSARIQRPTRSVA